MREITEEQLQEQVASAEVGDYAEAVLMSVTGKPVRAISVNFIGRFAFITLPDVVYRWRMPAWFAAMIARNK